MALRVRSRRCVIVLVSLALALVSFAGCAGDPDVDGAAQALVMTVSVDRPTWQRAPAGCEDISTEGLSLAACEGAPSLGALIVARGMVRCVDALALLRFDARSMGPITPTAGDPSPQPNRPPPPYLY